MFIHRLYVIHYVEIYIIWSFIMHIALYKIFSQF